MLLVSHRTLYILSGAVWMIIGVMLLNLGIGFLMHGVSATGFTQEGYSSLFTSVASMTSSSENAAIALVAIAFFIGIAKGRLVMQKAAMKTSLRLAKLQNPTSLSNLYSKSNLLIIAVMMTLGMSMKYLALPYDIRGIIDTAVGCALIQGALCYFRLPNSSESIS